MLCKAILVIFCWRNNFRFSGCHLFNFCIFSLFVCFLDVCVCNLTDINKYTSHLKSMIFFPFIAFHSVLLLYFAKKENVIWWCGGNGRETERELKFLMKMMMLLFYFRVYLFSFAVL